MPGSTLTATREYGPQPHEPPRPRVPSLVTPPPFQRFLDDHRTDVWRFLVASVGVHAADDCFQETFISALRAYPRLRAGSNLRAWILTIAHRKAIDHHRATARRPVPVAEVRDIAGLAEDYRDESTWEIVRELPARQRAVLTLRFAVDLPHRDIAAALGCSEAASRQAQAAGLARLREELDPR